MLDLTRSLDAAAPALLYQQLYDSLSAQIRAGRLRAGARLPGKRSVLSSALRKATDIWPGPMCGIRMLLSALC